MGEDGLCVGEDEHSKEKLEILCRKIVSKINDCKWSRNQIKSLTEPIIVEYKVVL